MKQELKSPQMSGQKKTQKNPKTKLNFNSDTK